MMQVVRNPCRKSRSLPPVLDNWLGMRVSVRSVLPPDLILCVPDGMELTDEQIAETVRAIRAHPWSANA